MSEQWRQPSLQFGIRTLLLLVVVASLPATWLAFDVNKSRQRNAVERTWNERGAHVNFAPDRRIVWLGYRADAASQIEDDDLVFLKDAPEVEYLDLRDTAITDAGLDSLTNLKKLQGINLSDTTITDVGLQILAKMEQLRVLDVSRTNVTTDGVSQFERERQNCELVHTVGPAQNGPEHVLLDE